MTCATIIISNIIYDIIYKLSD